MKIVDAVLGKMAEIQENYPVLVIALFLILSLFLGYYSLQLETDSSLDRMYRDDSLTVTRQDLVRNEFGSTDTLFVLYQIDQGSDDRTATQDIRDPEVIKSMNLLARTLREETTVSQVTSIADALLFTYNRLPETLDESKQMINDLPFDTSGLITADYQVANMIVAVNVENKPGSLEVIETAMREKIDEASVPTGVTLTQTGLPTLIQRIMKLLIDDNISTIAIALIGVFIILFIYFRNVFTALIAITPVVITLAWLAGTLYLLNIRVTMMIASVGAMMVGMGIDYSIHMTHGFHDNVRQGKKHPTRSTVVGIGGALFASVLTTLGGFFAMLLGSTPNSQTQGAVLGIGIIFAFTTSLILLPALLVIQRKLMYSKLDTIFFRTTKRKTNNKGIMIRTLAGLAKVQARYSWLVVGVTLVFTGLLLPGFLLVYMDTDSANWVPEDDPVSNALDTVGFNFGGVDSQNFLLVLREHIEYQGSSVIEDLREPAVLKALAELETTWESMNAIDEVDTPIDEIRQSNNGVLPQELEKIKEVMETNPRVADYFNEDYSIMLISIESLNYEREDYLETLQEAESVILPEEVELLPEGGQLSDIELENSLGADTVKTTLIGFVLVILIAAFFYRSLVAGFLAFIPILFAIIWTIATMGYIGLPFTILTSGMLAILMGMGIDFSIHIIHKTKDQLKEGHTIEEALVESLTSTGEAITVTTLTTAVGFLSLAFATLLGTQRLGYTLSIGIVATFAACLFIVPAVLAIQHKMQGSEKNA